jgi:Zn-dependent peptidase ImmA (M78 family)
MQKYKNASLDKIAKKYQAEDFNDLEGVFVFPVGEVCDKLGINVEFIKLDKGKSGYYDSKTKTIFVNDDYPAVRNLFTIAHEIGHFVLHEGCQNRFDEYHNYTPEELKREKEANDFAGELLMPQYKFKEVFDEVRGDFKKIADRFGVSHRATEVRAFWLGLIDNI